MNEFISFPENLIPEAVALFRRGLELETDPVLRRCIERQCCDLEQQWECDHSPVADQDEQGAFSILTSISDSV